MIAVGPGRTTEKGELVPITFYKVGDTVLYSKYSGSEVKLEGKDYIVVSEKIFSASLWTQKSRLECTNGC